MFRSLLAGKSRQRAAIVAGALVGVITPLAAHASLTVQLSLSSTAAGIATTASRVYVDPTKTVDIPVYVYATVTGTTATDYQGLSYLYYNLNGAVTSNATATASGIAAVDTATSAFATTFNANGVQAGTTVATSGTGLLIGDVGPDSGTDSSPSGVIKARSTSGGAVFVQGSSATYLVETLEVKPSVFAPSTTTALNASRFYLTVPNVGSIWGNAYSAANWNEDSTNNTISLPTGTNIGADGSAGSQKNASSTGTSYAASGSGVSVIDTIKGDVNDDGTVNLTDIGIVIGNYKTMQTWSGGNFEVAGSSVVNLTDIGDAIGNYKANLNTLTPSLLESLITDGEQGGDPALVAQAQAALASVPEPASLSLLAVGALTILGRRRRTL